MKELAQDVWQLRGFPPNFMNVYLAGDLLVDTATRFAARRILSQLEGRELSLVALTHAHADHQSSAHAVCEARKVPLACHEADVPFAEGRRPMLDNMPESRLNRFLVRVQMGPTHPVHRILRDGDQVGQFRVVHAPGHTPGHVIYFREQDRVAIVGDVAFGMNPVTGLPGVHEPPKVWTLDPQEARRSIRKLLELSPSLVCFGHGPPLSTIEKLERLADRLG